MDYKLKNMSSTQTEAAENNEDISFYNNVFLVVMEGSALILIDMACTFATMYIGA
jgi:hypothetical protein